MSSPNTPTYKTLNWSAYNKAVKRRGSLTMKGFFGMALRQTTGFVESHHFARHSSFQPSPTSTTAPTGGALSP
jgi:hypothetical protein